MINFTEKEINFIYQMILNLEASFRYAKIFNQNIEDDMLFGCVAEDFRDDLIDITTSIKHKILNNDLKGANNEGN